MQLTLNRKALLKGLDQVSVALNSRSPLLTASYVQLVTGVDRLYLRCDCGQVRAETHLAIGDHQPGEVLVPHRKLLGVLQREHEEVKLSTSGTKLAVELGGVKVSLAGVDPAGFTPPRKEVSLQAVAALPPEFPAALELACASIGDGKTHEWNVGVQLRDDGRTFLSLSAADGKQLARLRLPTTGMVFDTVVPGSLVRPLVSRLDKAEELSLEVYPNYVNFQARPLCFSVSTLNLGFGPVEEIASRIDEQCTQQVSLPRESLLRSLQGAASILEDGDWTVSLSVQAEGLQVVSQSVTGATFEEVLPCKVGPLLPSRRINHQMLINYLRTLQSEQLSLCYSESVMVFRLIPEEQSNWPWYLALMTTANP